MDKLRELNLVARVVKELENFMGISDKSLAEYIIQLYKENGTQQKFSAALRAVELPDSLIASLYKTITALSTATASSGGAGPHRGAGAGAASSSSSAAPSGPYKSLAIPDSAPVALEDFRGGATGLKASAADVITDKSRDGYGAGAGGSDGRYESRGSSGSSSSSSAAGNGYGAGAGAGPSGSSSSSSRPGPPDDAPQLYGIYDGKVTNIKDFGCFVELMGLKVKSEGLVHISAIRAGARLNHPSEGVSRGQVVKVKVISITGGKLSLSMKDVDQGTGQDLMPIRQAPALDLARERMGGGAGSGSNASALGGGAGRSGGPSRGLGGLSGVRATDDDLLGINKRTKRMSSPERFETKQLIASGVLDISEYPGFEGGDEDGFGAGRGGGAGAAGGGRGLLRGADELDEAEFEIEVADEEPQFLAGQTRFARDLSPVKLVANPDGSLQRAAMTQSALTKERRELKEQQKQQLLDSIPKDIERAWVDPLPQSGDRHLAQELRGG